MSNIYLTVTIEKNWRSQKLLCPKFKKFVSRSVFETHRDHWMRVLETKVFVAFLLF